MSNSRITGFYDLTIDERLRQLCKAAGLDPEELAVFQDGGLSTGQANYMVENVVGIFGLPLGIGLNFFVNGREVLVPMAIEEASVIAGASFMAKLARHGGGFIATTSAPEMIGQCRSLM